MKLQTTANLADCKRIFLIFTCLLLCLFISSCGVWVGSPTEEDTPTEGGGDQGPSRDTIVTIGSDHFPSTDTNSDDDASSEPGPITSGVFVIDDSSTCTGTLSTYTSTEEKKIMLGYTELGSSAQEVTYLVSFESEVLSSVEEVGLSNLGSYTITVNYTKNSASQSCVLILEYLKEVDSESYQIDFTL